MYFNAVRYLKYKMNLFFIDVIRNGENISTKQVGQVWLQFEGGTSDNRKSAEFEFLSASQWK
jgi:hypothetical protein